MAGAPPHTRKPPTQAGDRSQGMAAGLPWFGGNMHGPPRPSIGVAHGTWGSHAAGVTRRP